MTQEEAFSRKKQDVSHMRIFGTLVYVQIPKHQQDKMGS